MKITIFNSSPHANTGVTHKITQEFVKGANDVGAETENIFLVEKNIGYCHGCYNCWSTTPGKCIISDDMAELIAKLVKSDVVVFATPLHVDNVSGIMKTFMDRLIPLLDPHIALDGNKECYHPLRRERVPKIVVISSCGFPETSHFQVLRLLFQRIARNMSTEVIAEIYCPSGKIFEYTPLILKSSVNQYLKLLQQAGKEIAEKLQLSEKTAIELAQSLCSGESYLEGNNRYWDSQLSKL